MDAQELARWTRFAAKGGIGKCSAIQDCVAERGEDLMFLKDDEIVVLYQLPEEGQYLGYCEGVVGRFQGSAVRFHGKLKKAVYTKRQSGSAAVASSSRPVSVASRSPASSSQSPATYGTRAVTSPSPINLSLVVPSLPDSRPSPATRATSTTHTYSLPPPSKTVANHNRTPSTTSSTSHHGSHSRSHSQTQAQAQTHAPSRISVVSVSSGAPTVSRHVRNPSTASSQSAYSSISRPSSRAPSRSESIPASGSEDTQHIIVPPPLPSSFQATSYLTDGSSANSLSALSPSPITPPSFIQSHGTAPASLFQGRARSGPERFVSSQPGVAAAVAGSRERGGSDTWPIRSNHAVEWETRDVGQIVVVPAEEEEKEPVPVAGPNETFRSVSIYSVDSEPESGLGEEEDDEDTKIFGRVGFSESESVASPVTARVSQPSFPERTILIEDSDGEDVRVLAASPDNLSDAGFDIGMTLLQEDDGEDSTDDGKERYAQQYNNVQQDLADEETAVGHELVQAIDPGKLHAMRQPRKLVMRVMNPDSASASPSFSGSDMDEDVTAVPAPVSRSGGGLSATTSPRHAALAPRPPFFGKQSTSSVESRASSRAAPTDDDDNNEPWESDADIYDDYRYSRYSTYSGSPAQFSSQRASRASTRSGKSKASETKRPRNTSRPESVGEQPSSKSIDKGDTAVKQQTVDRESVLSTSTTATAKKRPRPLVVSTITNGQAADSLSPQDAISAITPGAISALAKAFRESVESHYSRDSARSEEHEHEDRRDTLQMSPRSNGVSSSGENVDDGHGFGRARAPTFASDVRERLRATSPLVANFPADVNNSASRETSVVVQEDDGPPAYKRPDSRPMTPAHDNHLRVASPLVSAPPSPLNPGFPPSPLNPGFPSSPLNLGFPSSPLNTGFPSSESPVAPVSPSSPSAADSSTAPLSISKSYSPALPSPSTPRHPISPPAIPFTGIPRPGLPPAHMQYAQQMPMQDQSRSPPPPESLSSALQMAKLQRAATIHGHTQSDLLSASGPVPISFLLPGAEPPNQQVPFPPAAPYAQPDARAMPPQPPMSQEAAALYANPVSVGNMPELQRGPTTVPERPPGSTGVPIPSATSLGNRPPPIVVRANSVQVIASGSVAGPMTPTPPASPLPRANFFPKARQPRPRSRSFSDFSSSEITDKVSKTLGKPSTQEEGHHPFSSRPSSPSSRQLTPSQAANLSIGRNKPGPATRPAHGPSPLSLPPTTNNNITVQSAPNTPLPSQTLTPSSPTAPLAVDRSSHSIDTPTRKGTSVRTPSPLAFRSPTTQASNSTIPISPLAAAFSPPQDQSSGHSTNAGQGVVETELHSLKPPSPLRPPAATTTCTTTPTTRGSNESVRTHSSSFTRSDMASPPPFPQCSPSSSPMHRSGSLRSKISISALRPKGYARCHREGGTGSEAPLSPVLLGEEETVQVQDMEFELVRPALLQPPSSDVSHGGGDDSSDSRDGTGARSKSSDLLRLNFANSPEAGQGQLLSPDREPSAMTSSLSLDSSLSKKAKSASAADASHSSSVQAHRDRELKWMSTMSSIDPAQARKSKKIKKLLIDGVPSSVRYLVWAHVSDSRARKIPNVYAQFSQRRPPMARDIERDVLQSFPDNVQLRDPKGPLVSVLFAYIAMVPDLRYHRGLVVIAGHLLLQSPEEDAFWTFLAMMDRYLRPYFMPTSPQLKIDTNLFTKTVEGLDSQLAARLFTELNIRPLDICGVWFSSVFAGSLPLPHLHRVWDLFIYEGIPFLFRVGLAILSLVRRYFLDGGPMNPSISPLAYLLHPPAEAFPADPEAFIAQTLAIKLKDDDIRKLRIKSMEAAAKQQQQQRAPRISAAQVVPSHPHLQMNGKVVVS